MPEQGGRGADGHPRRRDAAPGLIAALLLCAASAAVLWLADEDALALTALAAVGLVVATRGAARRLAGILLAVVAGAALWHAVAGGIPLAVAAYLTTVHGPRWPGLGARYDRTERPDDAWAALDRGEDPTEG